MPRSKKLRRWRIDGEDGSPSASAIFEAIVAIFVADAGSATAAQRLLPAQAAPAARRRDRHIKLPI
jgi:hypothetical protein